MEVMVKSSLRGKWRKSVSKYAVGRMDSANWPPFGPLVVSLLSFRSNSENLKSPKEQIDFKM